MSENNIRYYTESQTENIAQYLRNKPANICTFKWNL